MKRLNWLPKLSRKQKVVRNLLVVAVLIFLAWSISEFRAPTPAIALQWQAEEYGLPKPEVLYCGNWGDVRDDRRDVVFRAGDFFAAATEYRFTWFGYGISDFRISKLEGPVAFIQERGNAAPEAVYAYADLPEAVRAECVLRLQGIVNGREFDETYTIAAESNESGLYSFPVERKYENGNSMTAEELILWVFQSSADGSADPDFSYRNNHSPVRSRHRKKAS